MHQIYKEIPSKLVENATYALTQANMQAVFFDPGNEHWGNNSVLSAAQAGELAIKAVIALKHPLLIFKNVFDFDDNTEAEIDIGRLLKKAKTHDFEHLPKILWAVNKERLPDIASFQAIREMRNAIQHFYHPDGLDGIGSEARTASLNFIYRNVDPLLKKHFDINAVEYHEDHSVGYDFLVENLVSRELKFSMPSDFDLGEINLKEALEHCSSGYRHWMHAELTKVGKTILME